MASTVLTTNAARCSLFAIALVQSTTAFTMPTGSAAPNAAPQRSGTILAMTEPVKVARDALMHRAVERQLTSFAVVGDHVRKQYLAEQWMHFLRRAQMQSAQGSLTNFLGDLQRTEVTSIFVPKRSFRGLSQGNPYAPSRHPENDGEYEEISPQGIVLRLISCREGIASSWVELLPSLALPNKPAEPDEPAMDTSTTPGVASASAASASALDAGGRDKQLLLGIATKLAARAMLRDLSHRPSCRHMHQWLESYLLVQHAADLTERGSVERLHANLASQPICIRGGALVDPLQLSLELLERSTDVLEHIETDLREAPEHIVPLTAGFLESCFDL